jgi:hypothetical protein
MTISPEIIDLLTPLIIAIIGVVIAYFHRKGYISTELSKKLELDVQGSVAAVQHEYMAAIKAANEDGVVTPQEAENARKMALAKLISVGKDRGINYVKTYGITALVGLIEKKVTELK